VFDVGKIMRPYIPGIMPRTWYTQREWDRVVGWGKVPKEYAKPESEADEQKDRSVDENTDD
jgi:hypothetical protein